MSDLGIFAGVSEGLKNGLLAFNQAGERKDKVALAQQEAEQRRMQLAQSLQKEKFDQQQGRAGLLREGYRPLAAGEQVKPGLLSTTLGDESFSYDPEEIQQKKLAVAMATAGMKAQQQNAKVGEDTLLKLSEGNSIPQTLSDLRKTLEENKDLFGPIQGRYNAVNPYDTRAQTVKAQLKTAAQVIGKYLEGGKLTDKDVPKYEAMLSALSDNPDVALNKLDLIERKTKQKQISDIAALKDAGKNVSSVDKGLVAPELPKTLSTKPKLAGPSAEGLMPKMSPEDAEALQWANAYPKDPRAAQIKARLGSK